ncbi:hypothetical protein [Streptomyces sp. NBC_01643]|uniref:hypothetical protein n=1 Tax=Streptomyces sp. NBC_01643 TaxID=2975906 RepID=UPI002F918784|nr:hypothetical protein OHB03_46820 [Streptomyces sp. NBC_01643]
MRGVDAGAARTPLGSIALTQWHDGDATNKCANVMTVYENRSDTAVISITQKFQTSYTPKHADGECPDDVDGPVKRLTQDAGIAPCGTRTLYWQLCAPELAAKQNDFPIPQTRLPRPLRPDGDLVKSVQWLLSWTVCAVTLPVGATVCATIVPAAA